jgi:hypothetical protein
MPPIAPGRTMHPWEGSAASAHRVAILWKERTMSNKPAAQPLASELSTTSPHADQRVHRATLLTLVELPPAQVRHAQATPGQPSATEAIAGTMRESCPHCHVPLQLVLRHQQVTRSHLHCGRCDRCFDALYADGRSALASIGLSPE